MVNWIGIGIREGEYFVCDMPWKITLHVFNKLLNWSRYNDSNGHWYSEGYSSH